MIPNTVIFHYERDIIEITQKNLTKPDFFIFDKLSLLGGTYKGKKVERLYLINRNKGRLSMEHAKKQILEAGEQLEDILFVLRELSFEYAVYVDGGGGYFESANVSSEDDKRTGEYRSLLALEPNDHYAIRRLLANGLDDSMGRGYTFPEAVQKLLDSGIFGNYIINKVRMNG